MKKSKIACVGLLIYVVSAGAQDWPGFRGAEKQGVSELEGVPLRWSGSQKVVWNTAVPGRGHSSPIVSGGRIYLTTSYEQSSVLRQVLVNASYVSLLLFVVTGALQLGLASHGGGGQQGGLAASIRLMLSACMLVGVTAAVLLARSLLGIDRSWQHATAVSMLILMFSLLASLLLAPGNKRRILFAAVLSFAAAALAWLAATQNEFTLDPGSFKDLVVLGTIAAPAALGLLLLVYCCAGGPLHCRPASSHERRFARWKSRGVLLAGIILGLVPFCLLVVRAAKYRLPDRYVLKSCLSTDVPVEWLIVFAVSLVITASVPWKWRRISGLGMKWPMAVTFAGAAVLGFSFMVNAVFLQGVQENARALLCLDVKDGRMLWQRVVFTGKARGRGRMVTQAAATPTSDGKRVYVYFGEDGLGCVTSEGEIAWRKEEPLFRGRWGVGSSPVLEDGVLVVVSDIEKAMGDTSSIYAFESTTGDLLWHKKRDSHAEYAGYATPLIMGRSGKPVVVVQSWHGIKGYDLYDGEELWSLAMPYEGRHLVASMSSDDNKLYCVDGRKAFALDLAMLGTTNDPVAWCQPMPGEKSASPISVDNHLYVVTEGGRAFCLSKHSGEVCWKRLLKGRYYASITATGRAVLMTNDRGVTTVLAKGDEFQVLGENSVGESVIASPVPINERILLRTTSHLYCVGNE